jgi:hypothetical protein
MMRAKTSARAYGAFIVYGITVLSATAYLTTHRPATARVALGEIFAVAGDHAKIIYVTNTERYFLFFSNYFPILAFFLLLVAVRRWAR